MLLFAAMRCSTREEGTLGYSSSGGCGACHGPADGNGTRPWCRGLVSVVVVLAGSTLCHPLGLGRRLGGR